MNWFVVGCDDGSGSGIQREVYIPGRPQGVHYDSPAGRPKLSIHTSVGKVSQTIILAVSVHIDGQSSRC